MTAFLAMLTSSAFAQAEADVLMVGNSYTSRNDLPAILGEMLAQDVPGWSAVDAVSVTQAGQTWTGHLDNADGTNGDTALRMHLVDEPREWAFVVLQEQSQTPGFPQEEEIWQSSLESLLALDLLVAQTGADTLLFATWGRRAGDAMNPELYPDYATMQDAITAGYLTYLDSADRPMTIAPVGEAFRVVWEQSGSEPAAPGTPFWELYSSDGSHPSMAGTTLAAATMVMAWTGRRPTPLQSLADMGVDVSRQESLFDAAEAVTTADPTGDFPWPWVYTWDEWDGKIHGDVQRPMVLLEGEATTSELHIGDGSLVLGAQADLTADTIVLTGDGALIWKRGYLTVGTLEGSLLIPDEGVLDIEGSTQVTGEVTGTGTIHWSGTLDGVAELPVLTTTGLNVANLTVEIDGDLAWTVRDDTLWVFGQPTPKDHERDEADGCGCSSPSGAPAPFWLVAIALLVRRRR